jgi:hypothetical protein
MIVGCSIYAFGCVLRTLSGVKELMDSRHDQIIEPMEKVKLKIK